MSHQGGKHSVCSSPSEEGAICKALIGLSGDPSLVILVHCEAEVLSVNGQTTAMKQISSRLRDVKQFPATTKILSATVIILHFHL